MFLIRAVFWLTLLVAFIPVNPADLKEGQRAVSTGETIVAAQALLADLSGFCERNQEACGTGKELFSQLGAKALTGARHVIQYLEENADKEAPAPDKISTGSLAPKQPATANP